MKHIIYIIPFFVLLTSCSNGKQTLKSTQDIDTTKTVQIDWSEKKFLKPYIDSIKGFKKGNVTPSFLLEDCFDYNNKFYWKPKHNPKSFRKQIIFSINNSKTLKLLLKNKNNISNIVCEEKLEHPYGGDPSDMDHQKLTNIQLIKMRLSDLEN